MHLLRIPYPLLLWWSGEIVAQGVGSGDWGLRTFSPDHNSAFEKLEYLKPTPVNGVLLVFKVL